MKKTAVMYSAGKIGRGFIGALMAESGYEVVFIDMVPALIDMLNETHSYSIQYVDGDKSTQTVTGVRAVNGRDADAVAEEIANAEILATSVRAENLVRIAPLLAKGIRLRIQKSGRPLNILICENLMDASKFLRPLLEEHLTQEEMAYVGLIETSIGRMVPDQNDPSVIRTESYCHLPVDKDAFVGPIPYLAHMEPYSPFRFCVERKLFIHNMMHAVSAYLGMRKGYSYIHEALADEEIRVVARGAVLESAHALAAKYNMPEDELLAHAEDILVRLSNPALMDTCERVGADIPRKLAYDDRLVGAARNVLEQGNEPKCICTGIAAGLVQLLKEKDLPREEAANQLYALSSLDADHPIARMAMEIFETL